MTPLPLARTVQTELRIAWTLVKTNLRASAEFRVSFAIQIFGMVLNNVGLAAVWVLFFAASGPINGWSMVEVIALQGFSSLAYGFAFSLGAGAGFLPTIVHNGSFDSLLVSPRSLALRILTVKSSASAIGDVLFGVLFLGGALLWSHATLEQWTLALLTIIPASLLFAAFLLTCSLVAFLLPDADGVARNFFEVFITPAINPSGVLSGGLRTFFILAIPAITASSLPVEAIRDSSWGTVGLVWLITIGWVVLTQFLLSRAVRHYESGNLTGARG